MISLQKRKTLFVGAIGLHVPKRVEPGYAEETDTVPAYFAIVRKLRAIHSNVSTPVRVLLLVYYWLLFGMLHHDNEQSSIGLVLII